MASTYTSRLRLELQADGENSNTWGQKANSDFQQLEEAIAGYTTVATLSSTDVTLTTNNATTDQSRPAFLELQGTLTGNIGVIIPSVSKGYTIRNATSGAFTVTIKALGGTGVVAPQSGLTAIICDGASVYSAITKLPGALDITGALSVASTFTVGGATSLASTLVVNGATSITGAANFASTVSVSGTGSFLGAVSVSGTGFMGGWVVKGATTVTNGAYLPSTNQMELATNSTKVMVLTSVQNVGINTASPKSRVHISDADATKAPLRITTSLSDATYLPVIDWDYGTPALQGSIATGVATGVSSTQSIFVVPTSAPQGMLIVNGASPSGIDGFTDLLAVYRIAGAANSQVVMATGAPRGSPGTRSYVLNGTTGVLTVSISDGKGWEINTLAMLSGVR